MKKEASASAFFLQAWVKSPNHNQCKFKTQQNPLFKHGHGVDSQMKHKGGKQGID